MKKLCLIATILLLILTPKFNAMANESRTVNGFGGECLIWTIPMLAYGVVADGTRKEF